MQVTIELNKKDLAPLLEDLNAGLDWARGRRDRARNVMHSHPDLHNDAVQRFNVLSAVIEQIEAHLQDCNCVLPEHICGDCQDTGIEEENNG